MIKSFSLRNWHKTTSNFPQKSKKWNFLQFSTRTKMNLNSHRKNFEKILEGITFNKSFELWTFFPLCRRWRKLYSHRDSSCTLIPSSGSRYASKIHIQEKRSLLLYGWLKKTHTHTTLTTINNTAAWSPGARGFIIQLHKVIKCSHFRVTTLCCIALHLN